MRLFLLCVLALPFTVHAQAPTPTPPAKAETAKTTQAPTLLLRARLDRDAIRAAIADLPAEPRDTARRFGAAFPDATPCENFAKDFANARLPDCLHADGLKNQPTFFLGGVLALPFIAVAKVRGVCR